MELRLTPDPEAFVPQAIESGRLHRPEHAVEEALRLRGVRHTVAAISRRFSSELDPCAAANQDKQQPSINNQQILFRDCLTPW